MSKVELLAPAGNLEKAMIALKYGADAVYVGGRQFSLRARASNFSLDDISTLTSYAHTLNKKVYVTCNIIPHDDDLDSLEEYLKELENRGVDAIITSSLYIVKTCERVASKIERHISTQMSITNYRSVEFFKKMKASRVVLAREVSLEEMREIKKHSDIELEVFIHGGMCSSYSGRCVLSNYFTSRDANRGGCAHSCRWNYDLFHKGKKITKKDEYFTVGSKDLCAVNYISDLLDLGVSSLKIEGRMKSTYYLACVIRCYRMLIDKYEETNSLSSSDMEYFLREIEKAENRVTSNGFYDGLPTQSGQLYDTRSETPTKEYIARVIEESNSGQVLVEQRNYFEVGDEVEAFGPHINNTTFTISKIIDFDEKEELTIARHPLQRLVINTPIHLSVDDMIRKVK